MLENGEVPLKLRSSLQSVMLAATWYPGRGDRPRRFLRAGRGGFGWAGLTFIEIEEEPARDHVSLSGTRDRTDETGMGSPSGGIRVSGRP